MDCDESDVSPEKMAKLDENEKKSRWVNPVLQKNTLERLLNVTINICSKKPEDLQSQTNRCFLDLTNSFKNIFYDDAINDWEPQVHDDVNAKCKRLVELCVCKMDEDSIPVFDVLALVLDPNNKFHTFNATRMSESAPPGSDISDEKVFAHPSANPECPRGWLVDLINSFGNLDGFLVLLTRFRPGRRSLTIPMIHALLRPFVLCHELLTVDTIVKYFMPIVERVQILLDALTDEELKEEAKNPSFNQDVSDVIGAMKSFVSRVPKKEEMIQNIASLEVRLIERVQTVRNVDESMAITLDSGRDEYLFCLLSQSFQSSWDRGDEKRCERMLEYIERHAKDDTNGTIAPRVLTLLWDSALSDNVSTTRMEKALNAHFNILSHFSPHYCDTYMIDWLDKCVDKLKSDDTWALPTLHQIKKIAEIYMMSDVHLSVSGECVVNRLEEKHGVMTLIINSFTNYMERMRQLAKDNPNLDRTLFKIDGRYNHVMQVKKRLKVFNCLSRIGDEIIIVVEQVKQIWLYLIEQPIFVADRELGFDFLFELMETTYIREVANATVFFEQHILQLDPQLLTVSGIQFFEHFFDQVNKDDNGAYKLDKLIGVDYLWRVVVHCPEKVAHNAFEQLGGLIRLIGSQLDRPIAETQRIFIDECANQLQTFSNILSRHTEVADIAEDNPRKNMIVLVTDTMSRVTKFLQEYIKKCGWRQI